MIVGLFLVGIVFPSYAFKTEDPATPQSKSAALGPFEMLEAGLITEKASPASLYYLSIGEYEKALASFTADDRATFPWIESYLRGVIEVAKPLERRESEHFVLFTPPGQAFLSGYALESLEKTADHIEKAFGHRPVGKVRVEIYPTKEDFSIASTLSLETLERSGAIGICKFHRLMIMSPRTLPMGYRWLDALSHEYLHMIINEMSGSRAELWLHEGTARYFETSYRSDPPDFLTPHQKTALMTASEKKELVPFEKMSPSMVYLKDQEQVSLAFAQVSHAISVLIRDDGVKKFVSFMSSLKKTAFPQAFRASYGKTPADFESYWQKQVSQEKWEKTKGTMSDDIQFTKPAEESLIGANVKGRVRLGDRMRMKNLFEGALIEYEKALEEEPDNAIVLLKAARTHLALGEKDPAIQKLRRATEKNPNYQTPHIELAIHVEPIEAIPHLLEAIAINPFDPRVHQLLEENYRKVGKTKEADSEGMIFRNLSSH